MLSDDELTTMRADVAALLPSTCNLLTATETSDGQGGFTATWGTVSGGTAVPCRLDYVRGVKVMVGGALQPYSGWLLTLPYDTTITPAYRVLHAGRVYTVKSEDSAKDWPVSVRVALEAV
jgi:hypothetical protein